MADVRVETPEYVKIQVHKLPKIKGLVASLLPVFESLLVAGHTPYVFGGCLRDALLNKLPKDIDIFCGGSNVNYSELLRAGFSEGTAEESHCYEGIITVLRNQDSCIGMRHHSNEFPHDIWHVLGMGGCPNIPSHGPLSSLEIVPTSLEAIYYDVVNREVVMIPEYLELIRSRLFWRVNPYSPAFAARQARYIGEGFTPIANPLLTTNGTTPRPASI